MGSIIVAYNFDPATKFDLSIEVKILPVVTEDADNIFDDVQEELFNLLEEDVREDISFEISVIVVDAFMRCKILEEPPKK